MKIALFTDAYVPQTNGVVVSVRTLREGLLSRGHDVTVFAPSHPGAAEEERVVRLPSFALRQFPAQRLATPIDPFTERSIKNASFDIIHTHTEFSVGQFGFRAAAQLKIPHIHTYHTVYENYTDYVTRGHFERPARKIVTLASRYICNRCDGVVAPSDKTYDLLRGYGVNAPIHIIPTGIDSARFARTLTSDEDRAALRASLGIAPGARVLLTLGRVAYEKNIVALFEQVTDYLAPDDPVLAEARRGLVFLIVGDGPALGELRQKVSGRVICTGEILWEDVPQYYHISDVFVSMSESETQGLTFIESLAAGCPVVAQYNECFDGILEGEVSASLFSDVGEFGARLDEVLFDVDRRERYIRQGLKAARALSAEAFAKNVEAVYQETRATYAPRASTLRRVFS
ncbi:MAG: glycosyltransferase [Actinomycetia bacterium]|nr:glycosyltransferase [Actinomycetes bacterium]